MQLRRYLRQNWGAPFILLFILLLLISAAYLALGSQDFANDVGVYAFYSLVLGVALQIASYVKYGEPESTASEQPGKAQEPRELSFSGRLIWAIIIVALLVGGIVTAAIYISSGGFEHLGSYSRLGATLGSYSPLTEPDGSTIVLFSMSASGGALPYTFVAHWSDGVNQTNTTGVFQRTFTSGQTVPGFAIVLVTSSDGQNARVNVTLASR